MMIKFLSLNTCKELLIIMRKRAWKNLEIQIVLILSLTVVFLAAALYFVMNRQYSTLIINSLKEDAFNVHRYAEEVVDEQSFIYINTPEDENNEIYIAAHNRLDEIRRIANIRYLYTAKMNDDGVLIYVVDGLDKDNELFRHVGDPIEEEIIPMLLQCLNDEIVLSDGIMDTEWGVVYVTYFPFHDSLGNVIGAIGMEFDAESLYRAMNAAVRLTVLISAALAAVAILLSIFITRSVITKSEGSFSNMIKQLEQRDKMLLAVNQAANNLLTTDDDEDLEDMLIESMDMIGNSINADRIHIWQIDDSNNDTVVTSRYLWLSETGKQKKPIPKNWTFSIKDRTSWMHHTTLGVFTNSYVSDMEPDDRAFFSDLEIKTIVIIPLFLDDQLWGLFSIDDCKHERKFTSEEIDILHSLSLMMVTVITRHSLVAKRTHELALQTTLIETLFDTIPDCVFAKDLDLRFMLCNTSFLEYTGCKREDIIGKTDAEGFTMPPEEYESFAKWDRKVIDEGKTIRYDRLMQHANGSYKHVETIKTPLILDGKIIGVLGVARDITDHKEMERKIAADYEYAKKLQAEANRANQYKSVFLANMSHEIRTPMNTILGATEIIMQSYTIPAEIREWLSRIYSSGNLLLGIINDLLDFSKIEAGKLEINTAAYPIANVINEAVQLNIMRSDSKPIEFELQVDDKIPAMLIGDELRIKQILNNLLSNASKFTDKGKITLSFNFEQSAEKNNITLIIGVRDTGHGMTEGEIEKLFDEYTRFRNKTNTTVEGTGLGLSITRRLLELMDGEIQVESIPNEGSYFEVRLPQKTSGKGHIGKKNINSLKASKYTHDSRKERRSRIREIMPYGKVLIVDDVETNRFVAAGLMKMFRLQIDTAASGYEAIELIEGGKAYDVIFMDHMMPGIDGIEATKHLRDNGYVGTIIALTANIILGQSQMFLDNGFNAYLSKPIDIRQLTAILNKYVRDKQPPDVIEAVRLQMIALDGNNEIFDSYEDIPDKKQLTERKLKTKIKGLNTTKGIQRYNSDIDEYLKILHSYTVTVPTMLDGMDNINEAGLPEYTIKVHGIKGASYDIFAKNIAKKAGILETAARDGDIGYVRQNTVEFIEKARELIVEIEQAIPLIKAEKINTIKNKPDAKALAGLRNACEIYDMAEAEAIIAEISSYTYQEDNDLIEWLNKKLSEMSFSEIVERLNEYCNSGNRN
jgi:PAS domain S-box-containing protein